MTKLGGIIFGLLFFGIGAGFGVFALSILLEARAMRSWDEVPASIVECNLQSGKTSRVTATYTYTIDGKKYTGTRVSHGGGSSDNLGSFHYQAYRELKRAENSGELFLCRVNPARADDAILYWKPRIELLMLIKAVALVFGSAGLGMMLAALFGVYGQMPDNDDRILMQGANKHIVALGLTAASALFVATTFLLELQVFETAKHAWWYYLPFALVGIFALHAVYYTAQRKKFGVSVMQLSPCPALAGQTMRATVQIPRRLDATEVQATLRYVHRYTTGSGKHKHTNTDEIWQNTQTAAVYMIGENESQISFSFDIPAGYISDTRINQNGVWWDLTLKAKLPGINYKAVFEVPVKDGGVF